MPVVIFFACLDLEQKFSLMDGHYLILKTSLLFDSYLKMFRRDLTSGFKRG